MTPIVILIALGLLVCAALIGNREARLAALGKATALALYIGVNGLWLGPSSPGALLVAGALGVYWALLIVRAGATWLVWLLVSQGVQLMVQGLASIGWLTDPFATSTMVAVLVVQVIAIVCAASFEASGRLRPGYVSLLGAGDR